MRPVAETAAAADERRNRDEALARDPAGERRPRVGAIEGSAAEGRDDGERDRRERPDQEAGRQQQVGAQPRDRETHAREECDEDAGERHRRLEHEQELRPVVLRAERRMRQQQREAGREQH